MTKREVEEYIMSQIFPNASHEVTAQNVRNAFAPIVERVWTFLEGEIGNLSQLQTTDKQSVVNAINAVLGKMKTDIDKVNADIAKLGQKVGELEGVVSGRNANYIVGKLIDKYGEYIDAIGWNTSEYIDYTQGSDVVWRYRSNGVKSNARLVTYDSNKNTISSFLANSDLGYRVLSSSSSEFSNCAYIRATFSDDVKHDDIVVIGARTWRPVEGTEGLAQSVSVLEGNLKSATEGVDKCKL